MKVRIVGAGLTSLQRAEAMVESGIARWEIDSRSGLPSNSRIEMVESDYRVQLSSHTPNPGSTPLWGAYLVPVNQQVEDAFPGRPVLWTIGYDRRSAGGHQAGV